MECYPFFLSVVLNCNKQLINQSITERLTNIGELLSKLVVDYELIIVDNALPEIYSSELKKLTSIDGLPNLQIYSVTKEIDDDTVAWLGMENALGDYVAILDFSDVELFRLLPEMLEQAIEGSDVVFARDTRKPKSTSFLYRLSNNIFNRLYKAFNNGIHLDKDAPKNRLLNKNVVNFILQHEQPVIGFRYLPVVSGFSKAYLEYTSNNNSINSQFCLFENVAKGLKLLVSSTNLPMRFVTFLSLFGAGANLLYSIYVFGIFLFGKNVSAGWVSMSLQLSGMFFLISLVLFVLGEYVLYISEQGSNKPKYYIARELTSARILRHEKLNIEE